MYLMCIYNAEKNAFVQQIGQDVSNFSINIDNNGHCGIKILVIVMVIVVDPIVLKVFLTIGKK